MRYLTEILWNTVIVYTFTINFEVNPEKNLNQKGPRHKCVKGLLIAAYAVLKHCWN